MKVAAACFLALVTLAQSDTDYPHRDWGQVATLNMTVQDATTCIARTFNRGGDVLVLPMDGGNDIDVSLKPAWGPKMEPWERFKVRNSGGATTMRLFYRHPVSAKGAAKVVRLLEKRCLKIAKIEPVSQ